MAEHQESAEGGAPEWMVSYADMITIMMAFFVVLYASTSANGDKDKGGKSGEEARGGKEVHMKDGQPGKEEPGGEQDHKSEQNDERVHRVFESIYYRFGPDWNLKNCWTGGPPQLKQMRSDGQPSKALRGPGGENVVVIVAPKPGENVIAGGRVYFDGPSADLGEAQRRQLAGVAADLAGKVQKIEIRGHTSRKPLPPDSPFADQWDLAYARSRAVERYLVARGLDPRRIRLGVAADNEPFEVLGDPLKIRQNARVEIHLLNEWVSAPAAVKDAAPAKTAAAPAATQGARPPAAPKPAIAAH